MEIIVPYTHVEEETRIVAEAVGAKFVFMENDESYYWLITDRWMLGKGVVFIEHDMVPTVAQVRELVDCPEPWCAWPYEYLGTTEEGTGRVVYPGGGCCKYGAKLMEHIDIMGRVGLRYDDHPPRHYCRLDEWLMQELMRDGFTRHVHDGVVRHLHPNVSHNCVIVNDDLSFTRTLEPYNPNAQPNPTITGLPGAPTDYH